jgi:hypothetical protein
VLLGMDSRIFLGKTNNYGYAVWVLCLLSIHTLSSECIYAITFKKESRIMDSSETSYELAIWKLWPQEDLHALTLKAAHSDVTTGATFTVYSGFPRWSEWHMSLLSCSEVLLCLYFTSVFCTCKLPSSNIIRVSAVMPEVFIIFISLSRTGIPNIFYFVAHLIVDNFLWQTSLLFIVIKYKLMKNYYLL